MTTMLVDHLSRPFSRRSLSRLAGGLTGGPAGVALALRAPGAAGAACRGKRRRCGKRCRDLRRDRRHCGTCNNRCRAGETCLRGTCQRTGAGATPNRAFPQVLTYGTNRPSRRSQEQQNTDVRRFYDRWKADYLVPVRNNKYRVAFARQGKQHKNTVSEGQGYGMIIVAVMAGHDPMAQIIFDGLWRFARAHPSEIDSRLMDWNYRETTGNASAFDGDADIAYGLLLAHEQWGSDGEVDYLAAFRRLMDGIEASTLGPASNLPELGDWVNANGNRFNQYTPRTSDFMPGHFRAFAARRSSALWQEVIAACSQVVEDLQTTHSPETGLLPDFVEPDDVGAQTWRPARPNFIERDSDGTYAGNAGRVPWRLGTDALLNDNADAARQVGRISQWAEDETGGRPRQFQYGYYLDGRRFNPWDFFSPFFVSPLGVAAMTVTGQQEWLNDIYDAVRAHHEDYYADSVNLLCLLVMTGNFWQP